ncbi:HD-GYP domain-containing protein [Stutzerimonas degradans]|uniref:HD-GYP domain-containing protein n=1 Tax=Stutzerimonas degradans TaxID=2968968 RepID=UPI00141E9F3C|nr:hypothetical protein [Stutzerimonas degradans]
MSIPVLPVQATLISRSVLFYRALCRDRSLIYTAVHNSSSFTIFEYIPLSARIVALCDVYDALRSPRPYKQPWPAERAQQYVRENAGVHFDPQLVAVLEGIFPLLENTQTRPADAGSELRAPTYQPIPA